MSSIEKAMQQGAGKNPSQGGQNFNKAVEDNQEVKTIVSNNGPAWPLNVRELEQQGYLTPGTSRTKLAEEYRTIKRPLLQNAFGKGVVPVENGNLIVVVSSLPGEGKTFTSFNLAMSMATEKDTTVLLVDGDVLKGSLTKLLNLESEHGLTDVLLDQNISLNDVIVRTEIPKLSIIPAGKVHSHSTELLASSYMEQVVYELARRYPDRIVIIDAPPLLVTTEAPVLARLAGQILVVVEAGKTQRQVVIEAVNQLDNNKVIGMVLNKSRGSLGGDYYGQGYGYYGQ